MASKKKSGSDSTQPPMSPELRKRLKAQESIRELFGTVEWEGNLDQMREGRFPAWQDGVAIRRIKRIRHASER
jgi:hypothetical protein